MVDITNIVTVSTQAQPRGLGFYNVNNVMAIVEDEPVADFGTDKYRSYVSARDVETDWGTESMAYKMAQKVFAQTPNLLAGGGSLLIAKMEKEEKLNEAVSRLYAQVYFGGVITGKKLAKEEAIAVSDLVQTLDCIFILSSHQASDLEPLGLFKEVADKGNNHTKCILYTLGQEEAILTASAYAGRGFAVNFSAQNSCMTMNLKDLATVLPDSGINQTVYGKAKALGVDLYCAIEGLPKVISNGNPDYFDQLLNRLWFTQTVKVTVFNVLARTSSKIPQTEAGMNILKNAIRGVAEQGVYNGFLASGKWNSSETFGNQEDFLRNIAEYGYYVYSLPIALQSQNEREKRVAPVLQVAGKEAGAIHSASILIYFEA